MEWKWVILAASFFVNLMTTALSFSEGMIQIELLRVFGKDIALTSFLTTSTYLVSHCGGPIYGALVEATSCRECCIVGGILVLVGLSTSFAVNNMRLLFVTYGLVTGIGSGLSLLASAVAIGYNFQENLPLATGIYAAGGGIGSFIGPALFEVLTTHYSLHGTFLISGAIFFNITMCGMLMKPTTYEGRVVRTTSLEDTICERNAVKERPGFKTQLHKISVLLSSPVYISVMAALCMAFIGHAMMIIHMAEYATITGATKQEASFLLVLMGITSTFSRILFGVLVNSDVDMFSVYIGNLGLLTILTLSFQFYMHTYIGQAVFMSLLGVYSSGIYVQYFSLSVAIVDKELISLALGVAFMVIGVGWTIGPLIAGVIVDSGEPYERSFLVSGLFFLAATVFSLVAGCFKKKTTRISIAANTTIKPSGLDLKCSQETIEEIDGSVR